MSTPNTSTPTSTAIGTDPATGTDLVRVSDPFQYGYRGTGPLVRTLGFPQGTQRIWKSRNTVGLQLRDLDELGPAGHTPAGWLLPNDEVILEAMSSVTEAEVSDLVQFFTGANRHIDDIADMDQASQNAAAGGRCIRCDNIHGKPHLPSCPHYGKRVGDVVR